MPRLARTRKVGIVAVSVTIAALTLSACGSSEPEPDHGGVRGEATLTGQALVVTGIDEASDGLGPRVRAWATDGYLVVTTLGSGSCPWVPTIDEIGAETVALTLDADTEGACTADLGPTTFELPVDQDLAGYTVDVTFED